MSEPDEDTIAARLRKDLTELRDPSVAYDHTLFDPRLADDIESLLVDRVALKRFVEMVRGQHVSQMGEECSCGWRRSGCVYTLALKALDGAPLL